MKTEDIRMAKTVLQDGGVKVFQKDIKDVKIHKFRMQSLDGGYFAHREIYRVEMENGTIYEALRETVDKDNNFSLGSAKFITREVREVSPEETVG